MAAKMNKLLEELVKPIVKFPKDVKVSEATEEDILVLTLDVNKEDMGRVIGKQGRNAQALRTLLFAAASLEGIKVKLNINTDDNVSDSQNK